MLIMTEFSTGYQKKKKKSKTSKTRGLVGTFTLLLTDWNWLVLEVLDGNFLSMCQVLLANSRADSTLLLPFAQVTDESFRRWVPGMWVEQEIQLLSGVFIYKKRLESWSRHFIDQALKPLKPCPCQGSCLTRVPQKVSSLSIHKWLRKAFWGEEISPTQLTSSSMWQREGKVPSFGHQVSFSHTLPLYVAQIQDVDVLIISSSFKAY